MKVLGYIRVSSDESPLETQRAHIQKYLARNPDVTLVPRDAREQYFVDDGISGENQVRPSYNELLARLGDVDGIIVWDCDRLNRSFWDWVAVLQRLSTQRKWLINTKTAEKWDMGQPATSETMLFAVIRGWMAARELDNTKQRIAARIEANRAEAARTGEEWVWGRRPIQIQWSRVAELRSQGMKITDICRDRQVALHWNEKTKAYDIKGPVSRAYFYRKLAGMKGKGLSAHDIQRMHEAGQ